MTDITLEDVAKTQVELRQAIDGMNDNHVDEETVTRIATELLEQHKQALKDPKNQRRSFEVDDVDDDKKDMRSSRIQNLKGEDRLRFLQSGTEKRHLAPAKIASLSGMPLADVQAFHEASDAVFLLDALCKEYKGQQGLPANVKDTAFYEEEYRPMLQAMDTSTAAEGLEFIPTQLSSTLIERVNLELMVVQLFGGIVPMPTNPWKVPGRAVTRQRMGKAAENTADTGQTGFSKRTPGSRSVTLTAFKFAGEALVSKDAEEDSIIAMLPFMQDELVDWLYADQEDAAINGDTAGTQDSDFVADDPRRNWVGLRKSALAAAKTDIANAAPTIANSIRVNRKKMGKYGVRPANLTHLCSMSAYIQLLADPNVITMEKYGPNATIVTGELGRADGTPIVVSEYVRQDLNATGVYDATTTNRTEIITVYNRGFIVGERRSQNIQVLRELYAEYDQDAILISLRRAFAPRFPIATEPIVAVAYNVAA